MGNSTWIFIHYHPIHTCSQLKALVKVPVVLCSPLRPGQISEVVARIYLGPPPRVEGTKGTESPKNDHDEAGPEFAIPYESNLND